MKREADTVGGPTSPQKRYRQGDEELRFLIPSRVAGSIIGRGGQNIAKLRSQYKASITVPDCYGPERMLTISSDLDSCFQILAEVVPKLEESGSLQGNNRPNNSNSDSNGNNDIDLRMLVHQSQAGCVIGKGGLKIKELREKSGARIKIYSNCCPHSTDRVISVSGKADTVVECIKDLLATIKTSPIKGVNNPYDPRNYDEFFADEYGGFGDSPGGGGPGGSKNKPSGGFGGASGPNMRNNGPPMGGPRGGGRDNRGPGPGGPGNRGGPGNFGPPPAMGRLGPPRGGGPPNMGGINSGFGDRGGPFGGSHSMRDGPPPFGGNDRGGPFGSNNRGGSGNAGGPPAPFGGNYNENAWNLGGPMSSSSASTGGLGGNSSNGGGGRNQGGPMGGGGGPMGPLGGTGNQVGNQSGGNQGGAGGPGQNTGNVTSTQVTIPNDLAGAIIGKGGARIRKIRSDSGAGITIDMPLPGSNDRIITITGSQSQIQMAQFLLQQSVHENANDSQY